MLEETRELSSDHEPVEYERYVQLAEQRESLASALVSDPLHLDEDKVILREILSYDAVILQRMHQLKDEAAEGLKRMSGYKKQRVGYDNQYAAESFMFDKRN